jgi:hypothetical protein
LFQTSSWVVSLIPGQRVTTSSWQRLCTTQVQTGFIKTKGNKFEFYEMSKFANCFTLALVSLLAKPPVDMKESKLFYGLRLLTFTSKILITR